LICLRPVHLKTHILRKQREEEDFPYPTLFWRFNLQAFKALKEKSNPNHNYQNAFATLLLLSHKKNPHTFPSKHPNLRTNLPSYAQKFSTSALPQIA
jgi:hypothetical protein